MSPDVSLVINFHNEGFSALPAVLSAADLASRSRLSGISVEIVAVVDRGDPITVGVVTDHQSVFDHVTFVEFGDLALSRNFGIDVACGEFIAVLDGDDLWGSDWIVRALRTARAELNISSILHPHLIYAFDSNDNKLHSATSEPNAGIAGFIMEHKSSSAVGFDKRALLLNNLWTSNVFARRSIFIDHRYRSIDRTHGIGFEDWTWNIETLLVHGIHHCVVPETLHMVRMKESDSLGKGALREGLLPNLPPDLGFSVALTAEG